MLEVKNISFSYDEKVLNGVSFRLKDQTFLGIVGKSGGGKTSLLKIIAGYLNPDSGNIWFENVRLRSANEMLIPGYPQMSLVHQDFGLNPYFTVEENIREKILNLPLKLQNKLIREMSELLELTTLLDRKAIALSGGEQQRLSIARALVSEADLILLDEPFVHLDTPMRLRLFQYLKSLKSLRKTSFIFVTHNGEELLGLCDEVIYLKKGKIIRRDKPINFYCKPKSIEEALFFGDVNAINIAGKRLIFRPNQFSLTDNKGIKLSVKYVKQVNQGPLVHNYFELEQGGSIVLFDLKSMENVNCIYV